MADLTSLYVHVPFCTTKCGYCDFYSVAGREKDADRLVGALVSELAARRQHRPLTFRTIFVGGGTPTRLDAPALAVLLDAISACARLPDGEFTVEANPETVDTEKLALLRAAGVNRLSLGAQSFHENELAVLERVHDPASVGRSVRLARQAGFERLNLDLIFGVPGQTLASWRESVQRAIELEPTHLACYGLTYEPQTALTAQRDRGRVTPCDDTLEAEMFEATIEWLVDAGFEHYELSNYARPGHRCEHNLCYWRNEPYVGIGPSAASYMDGRRWRNIPNLDRYVQAIETDASPEIESETLGRLAAMRESAMLGLRLRDGIDVAAMRSRFGVEPLMLFTPLMAPHVERGWLVADERHIALTPAGLLFANDVMGDFLVGPVDETILGDHASKVAV